MQGTGPQFFFSPPRHITYSKEGSVCKFLCVCGCVPARTLPFDKKKKNQRVARFQIETREVSALCDVKTLSQVASPIFDSSSFRGAAALELLSVGVKYGAEPGGYHHHGTLVPSSLQFPDEAIPDHNGRSQERRPRGQQHIRRKKENHFDHKQKSHLRITERTRVRSSGSASCAHQEEQPTRCLSVVR